MAYEIPWGVRMDEALKERLKAEARRSDRSINKEIVHRLRQSLEAQDCSATQEAAA
jgi:predicted HicB family RNase H-like nuclease